MFVNSSLVEISNFLRDYKPMFDEVMKKSNIFHLITIALIVVFYNQENGFNRFTL